MDGEDKLDQLLLMLKQEKEKIKRCKRLGIRCKDKCDLILKQIEKLSN